MPSNGTQALRISGSVHDADRQLTQLLLGGDGAAFQQFFDAYFPRLYRFILRRTDDDAETARDVAQAALIKGVRHLDKYRGEASLFTWLCTFCRHEISDFWERRGKAPVTLRDAHQSLRRSHL